MYLFPRPLPMREKGPGTHGLCMCPIISKFSVKLSVNYSLLCNKFLGRHLYDVACLATALSVFASCFLLAKHKFEYDLKG